MKPVPEAGPAIDPLDPAQLEQYLLESSGLLKVRPPLTPAKSGDNFYHAIPFQASGTASARVPAALAHGATGAWCAELCCSQFPP